MNIHAGGIVWAGPYLHIAATNRGFVTARVDDIMRVAGDDERPDAPEARAGPAAQTTGPAAVACGSQGRGARASTMAGPSAGQAGW
jgi:hypothetical protein